MLMVLMIILGVGVAAAMFMASAITHKQSNQTLSDNDDNRFDALLDDFLKNIDRYNADDLKELKSNLQAYLDNRTQSVMLSEFQFHSSKQSAFHDLLLHIFSHQYKPYQIYMMLDSIDSHLIKRFVPNIKFEIIKTIEQYFEDNYDTDDDILLDYNIKINIYRHIEQHPLFQENQELLEQCKDELEQEIFDIVDKFEQDIAQRKYLEEKKSMQRQQQWQRRSYPNLVAPKKSNISHSTQYNGSSVDVDVTDIIVATTLLTDDDTQDELDTYQCENHLSNDSDDISLASPRSSDTPCEAGYAFSYASSDSYSNTDTSDSYSSSSSSYSYSSYDDSSYSSYS